ncbi:MAG TPA: DUF4157 domain-containing protein, partial [Myxococcales bacterium]|nr:DUF4157 domain-containing protein [Myxococcales bacterium]
MSVQTAAVEAGVRASKAVPRLAIGRRDDPLEREADRAADAAMRGPVAPLAGAAGTLVQRKCDGCEAEDEVKLSRKADAALPTPAGFAPASVAEGLRAGSGRALDGGTRSFFESRYGHSFANVRVHADSRADAMARATAAKAFTVGNDIVFAAGQFTPQTAAGKRLLAHELAHVVQQSGSHSLLQRAENDTIPGCAALTDTETVVDTRINAALASARATAGSPPTGIAVARNIRAGIGEDSSGSPGRSNIEVWADSLPATQASLPAQSATKYAGVTYVLWSTGFRILNPTMKVHGICIGSDKLGHFFQQGWTYAATAGGSGGTAAAEEQSERSEGGGFGLATTGVFSNADQEANRQGSKFYNDLVAAPGMTFSIARYISSRWSEVDNSNFYEDSTGHQVWANVLTASWTGDSWRGVPFQSDPLTMMLSATTGGAVTGTLMQGSMPS